MPSNGINNSLLANTKPDAFIICVIIIKGLSHYTPQTHQKLGSKTARLLV